MLELSLLGEITIRLGGEPITHFRSQTQIALLAYLAHTGGTHNRETLADLLWEARSTKQSLSNLRTALARLRQRVGDQLIVTRKTVAIAPAVHEQTDSVRFQTQLSGAGREQSQQGASLLAQGLEIYSGEFMAGFFLPHAPGFNDWLVIEQEHLRQIAMRGYRRLAGWQEKQGAFGAGVTTAQQWVTRDPLDESAQQQLMRLLAYDGRVSEAIRVYEQCRLLLQAELGIPPAPLTMALYESIQDGSLRTPDIVPATLHNLPRALTPLFGRREEIKKLTSILLNPDYPLLSITGAGGMGKTSLALATGRQLLLEGQHPFKDGIWFVSLEAIESDTAEKIREEAAALVGQAMGLYFHSAGDLWSQLLGQLASKNLLLILDNIEQFLTVASDLIMDLLEAGEEIQLLVTSRSSLDLTASVAFPLSGLETPAQVTVEALSNESVRLFAERAARLPSPFHLENHLAEVVAICQFVEGMPLAIELAAASLGRLMIDEIMPALNNNLQLLNSSGRVLPPRQRTLHAVFEYSWRLLDAREQAVLAQISIFRDGFTRQAAEAVLHDTASALYNLQHHALLDRDERGRFRIHPLLRQLAREKLSSPDMIEIEGQAVERHSIYFADFLASFADDLRRGVGQEAIPAILPEQANLRAAWQHAVQAGKWQSIAACLDSIHYFYQRKGFFTEEAALVDEAITPLQAMTKRDDAFLTGLLSRLLAVRARGYLNSAQFEEGVRRAEQACALAQRIKNASVEAQARLVLAQIHSTQHKREQALEQFEQVIVLAKTAQDQILAADGWIGIGGQIMWQADVKAAREPLQHALDLCLMLNYKSGELQTLILLDNQASREGAYPEAVSYGQQTLRLARLLGDVAAEAEVLGSIGVRLAAQADLAGAQNYYREALATFRRLNMPESEAWVLGELGYAAIRLGDYDTAENKLTAALAISSQLDDLFWQAWLKLRLGTLANERGEADQALHYIKEAFQTAGQFQNLNFKAAVLHTWGELLLSQKQWAAAEQKFQEAYDFRQGSGRTEQALPALAGLAFATYQQEKSESAAAHAEQLWQTWQTSPETAARSDLKLYWLLGTVWDGLGDCRANDLWQKAKTLLNERCDKIPDNRRRSMFQEQVPAHRAILRRPP